MRKRLLGILLAISTSAIAHPHAFIDMQTKPLVQDNRLMGFSVKWLLDEPSSSVLLYDLKQAKNDPIAKQKLLDEVMGNIVSEHYFSYLFDKDNHKIKYKKQPENSAMTPQGNQLLYSFDFLLATPQNLEHNEFTLMTYDQTYYVAMRYPKKIDVDFSTLPSNCQGSILEPNVDQKIQSYASSLDQSQKDEDDSLGGIFAQKIKIRCE